MLEMHASSNREKSSHAHNSSCKGTESFTHITSFLDPPSLLALSRVNQRLNAHIADDNTWRRAFCCQFLGISPEDSIHENVDSVLEASRGSALMLRREHASWKKEFVHRWNLRRYVMYCCHFSA